MKAKLSINEIKQQQMGLNPAVNYSSPPPFAMAAPAPLVQPMAAPMSVGGVGALDPWAPAPVRSQSPWSPPATRHTPNPFLS